MGTATVEVSGTDAPRWAADLHATLVAAAGPGDRVSPVEVQRSAELVIAIVGLVFAGVSTAKTIWDWWQARKPEGVTVRILLSDGSELDVSRVDRGQLEITFQQSASQR